MNDYLNIVYDKKTRPYTEYPDKLINYLFNTFQIKEGMSLLEPGCGRGEHLRLFKDLGVNTYGLDLSPESPLLAKDLNISACDLETDKLPYPDNHFDVVYSKSFLEHLQDPSKFLKEAYRVLKPGGLLLSMVPDWESQYKKFYDDYTHVSPFTIVSLKDIQSVTGFDNVNVYKFRQLPIVWKYPILNTFCVLISPFVPVRTTIPFLRWSRELMLIGSARKPKAI
ncbi:class I SAM-dependent methyltransferase [bacterium]|jgi:SAM-dependent methyltransferase|nr:class I SAM-dependent methyltransferase [bacterium]